MLYFANPTKGGRDAMIAGQIGMIVTPKQGNKFIPGVTWCADNGCFGDGYPGDDGFITWLASMTEHAAMCSFAVAPDVVCDAAATLERSAPILPRIRALGYPAALVAQNGLEDLPVPFGDFDVLFIGGDDAFKLGPEARDLVAQARAHGKRVHMGRVNSLKRLKYADAIGCHSADGTFLTFGPDKNLLRVFSWLRAVNDQQPLWRAS